MLLGLNYQLMRFITELVLVRTRSAAQLRAEVLALRHQLRVLERKVGKPASLGKGPTEKDSHERTSPVAYFTRRGGGWKRIVRALTIYAPDGEPPDLARQSDAGTARAAYPTTSSGHRPAVLAEDGVIGMPAYAPV